MTEHLQAKSPKKVERHHPFVLRLSLHTFFTNLSPRRVTTFRGGARVNKTQSQIHRNIF